MILTTQTTLKKKRKKTFQTFKIPKKDKEASYKFTCNAVSLNLPYKKTASMHHQKT